MNPHLQNILNILHKAESLTAEQAASVLNSLKDADKELELASSKLNSTEEVNRNTTLVLEETKEELEQKTKAVEAQNRELEIEAALEKVRSRSLAMHTSDELKDVVTVVFEKLQELDFMMDDRAAVIIIFTENSKDHVQWIADPRQSYAAFFKTPYTDHPIASDLFNAKESGIDFFAKLYPFEEKNNYFKYLFQYTDYNRLPEDVKKMILESKSYGYSVAFAKNSAILIPTNTGKLLSSDEKEILKRFTKVFEQCYIRFLDLQKAEAQAREARIEAALEKIRSRSLGMHHSVEIKDVVSILFEKLKELDMVFDGGAAIHLFPEGSRNAIIWVVTPDLSEPSCVNLPYDENEFENNPIITDVWNAKETGKDIYNKFYSFGEKNIYFDYVFKHNDFRTIPAPSREFILQADSYTASFIAEKNSLLGANSWTRQLFSDNDFEVLSRIARVFEQAYIRFLDLQKAEAQAREAKIEAALEKVRSRSLAMHKTDELKDVISLVFEKLRELNVTMDSVCIYTFPEGTKDHIAWAAKPDLLTEVNSTYVPYFDHPIEAAVIEVRDNGQAFIDKCWPFEVKNSHWTYLFKHTDYKYLSNEVKQAVFSFEGFGFCGPVTKKSATLLVSFTEKLFSEKEKEIIKRFGKVFDQAYIRFLDLQKAEAQALEAIKRASVDRVRAEIASMRTTNDLERITPLIWNELTTLGVPFIRCGVFIMDEEQQQVQSFLSTPDGKAIAAFRQPYNTPGEIARILEHWRQKKMYTQHWNQAQIIEFTNNLAQEGAITSGENFLTENRPADLYLHFLPFLQGMLYAGNTAPLNDDELQLVQSLADAFSTAYARYEDFNKLEAANIKIERTLVDLKQAQAQLVQSEKMASLGELTAGIAHEIQNPLNFVNNFSEVSNELIEEMNDEMEKGDMEEAKAIANDIKQNLEKILHHGKRADGIVKGMLQHSRRSSATKEPTDINKLADEYLRLAYHGLRAKDKSFNATLKTDYDESIGLINIIPQDIGRVLLNLYNNAFYAAPLAPEGGFKDPNNRHDPTVWVSIKRINSTLGVRGVLISVRDNGPGIPQKVLDKIFQPFFTTKPTGQGTGLGLSLSYDIVKAHGGEIKVETKEDEGTEFIIVLPIV